MPQEQIEEYLETIYDITRSEAKAKTTEIAKKFFVNWDSVNGPFAKINRGKVKAASFLSEALILSSSSNIISARVLCMSELSEKPFTELII